MKINISILLVLLSISFSSIAQNIITDSSTTIVSYWKKGDKKTFTLNTSKVKTDGTKVQTAAKSKANIEMTIIDETEKSYTITWKYLNTSYKADESNPFLDVLPILSKGLKLTYTTDEKGTFNELLNWQEIQINVNKIFDELLAEASKNDKKILEGIRKIYSSKDAIIQLFSKDIQMYHYLYGIEYKLNKPMEVETELPNPAGDAPIPASLTINLTSLKPKEDQGQVVVTQKINKEKAKSVINNLISKLAEAAGEKGKSKDMQIESCEMTDEYNFNVELNLGWIKKASIKRTVLIGNSKSIETREINKI